MYGGRKRERDGERKIEREMRGENCVSIRDVRVGPKLGQIGPKWYKSGPF